LDGPQLLTSRSGGEGKGEFKINLLFLARASRRRVVPPNNKNRKHRFGEGFSDKVEDE
jgi:hypothetical protein